MVRFGLPANPGDSIEFQPVRCKWCDTSITLVVSKAIRRNPSQVEISTSLPACCDRAKKQAAELCNETR